MWSIKRESVKRHLLIPGMTDIDYNLYPSKDYQMKWLRMFLTILYEQRGKSDVSQADVDLLYIQANKFSLV